MQQRGSVLRGIATITLPPRAGGVDFVLAAMGGILQSMLDVTMACREPSPSLWDRMLPG